ncbi:prenyltransferase [Nannocystis radixulma]|uniref:Prenyltransferase n=1 Tax=Nannocystis radixulma TaxID=2995305 RepID=A0ABT5BB53_9BACT|nr:prenyltransferase [Nannocystis radixulma]MDC0671364.1 prenyltransferase [Nannocystis radixulma]
MFDPAAWLQATRPLAQVNLVVPLWLGQALAFAYTGAFSLPTLYGAHFLAALLLLVIVFSNDYADRDADAANTTYNEFSGGSRVLPEGRLRPGELRDAAWLALAGLVGLSLYMAFGTGRPWTPVFVAAAALLVWVYNFAPLRLSYRGGGEVVQGLGTGVLLPLLGFYLQAGSLAAFPWLALVPLFLLGVVGNILTSLPDVPADRQVDKRSYAVSRGQWAARRHSLELLVMATLMGGLVVPGLGTLAVALLAAPALVLVARCVPLLGSADAEQRDECRRFILLAAGAAHLQCVLWSLALIVVGLLRDML